MDVPVAVQGRGLSRQEGLQFTGTPKTVTTAFDNSGGQGYRVVAGDNEPLGSRFRSAQEFRSLVDLFGCHGSPGGNGIRMRGIQRQDPDVFA